MQETKVETCLKKGLISELMSSEEMTLPVQAIELTNLSFPNTVRAPKKERTITRTLIDAPRERNLEIAFPFEGKTRKDITNDDYSIQVIPLGKPSRDQLKQGVSKDVSGFLKKVDEDGTTKKQLKDQVTTLSSCLQQLTGKTSKDLISASVNTLILLRRSKW